MPATNLKTVVFICTGNFYRSRFSEYLFNALATKSGLYWRATSRGLRAKTAANEGPISEFTAYRLTAVGVPFDWERFPVQLSEADLENADLVVALKKAEHHAMMANNSLLGRIASRIGRLTTWTAPPPTRPCRSLRVALRDWCEYFWPSNRPP